MVTIGTRVSGIMLAALVLPLAGTVQASLIHELEISELLNFTGTGQIEFITESGSDASGVSAFEFSGTGIQGNFSFTEDDIESISWSIDPDDWILTLNLSTVRDQSTAGGQVSTCVILQNDDAGGSCGGGLLTTTIPFSRVAQQIIGRTTTGLGDLITTAVHTEVPEPSPLALLVVGLAAVGGVRRHKSIGSIPG
jgi:hypothetical protein